MPRTVEQFTIRWNLLDWAICLYGMELTSISFPSLLNFKGPYTPRITTITIIITTFYENSEVQSYNDNDTGRKSLKSLSEPFLVTLSKTMLIMNFSSIYK